MLPKKVILEVYWNTLSINGVESSIDLSSNFPLSKNLFAMALNTMSIPPLLTFYSQYLKRLSHPLSKDSLIHSTYDRYITGGFVETNRSINKSLENKSINQSIGDLNQLKYIQKINSYCIENNIELILILAPVSPTITNSYSNYKSKLKEITEFANKINLTLLNYNDIDLIREMRLVENKDWYDGSHLAQSGVIKFNSYLIQNQPELITN